MGRLMLLKQGQPPRLGDTIVIAFLTACAASHTMSIAGIPRLRRISPAHELAGREEV